MACSSYWLILRGSYTSGSLVQTFKIPHKYIFAPLVWVQVFDNNLVHTEKKHLVCEGGFGLEEIGMHQHVTLSQSQRLILNTDVISLHAL